MLEIVDPMQLVVSAVRHQLEDDCHRQSAVCGSLEGDGE